MPIFFLRVFTTGLYYFSLLGLLLLVNRKDMKYKTRSKAMHVVKRWALVFYYTSVEFVVVGVHVQNAHRTWVMPMSRETRVRRDGVKRDLVSVKETWVMPISRETRVRRDGFSNSASSVRCFNASVYAWGSFFIFKARSMTLTI